MRRTTVSNRLPKSEMEAVAKNYPGRMGFHVEDIESGEVCRYAADERYPTASVCKVTVMMELFRQAGEGILSLDDRRRVEDNVSRHGSGLLSLTTDSPEFTLRDFCRMMITVSDNIATDVLMGVVGNDNINAMLDRLGYPQTRTPVTMGRYHYRMRGFDSEPTNRANDELQTQRPLNYGSVSYSDSLENNVARPVDMADMLRKMHRGEVFGKAASEGMIDMLKLCRDQRMIRKHLKPETVVAHKSGSSGVIKGNVGIVYLPTGPLIVSAFALANAPKVDGGAAIGEVTRLAVKALSPDSLVG